jgi:hypothetical protein
MLVTNCTIRLSADMGLRASDIAMSRVCISHLLTDHVIIGASARLCWRKGGKNRDGVMGPSSARLRRLGPIIPQILSTQTEIVIVRGSLLCLAVVGLGLSGRRSLRAAGRAT